MFPIGFPGWGWGWGWVAFVGFIIFAGIFLLPWFFFLLNLQTTLNRVSDRNRAMPAGYVWLNFIPVFNLGWFIYTVMKVRDSVRAEYWARGWAGERDFGYNVGLAAGILAIVSFFLGWIPVLGWGLAVADLVCWIIYWLKTAELKNRLGEQGIWGRTTPPPYGYPVTPPSASETPPYQAAPWQAPVSPATQPPSFASTSPAASAPSPGPVAASAPIADSRAADSTGQASAASDSSTEGSNARQCAGCGTEFGPSDRFCRTCGLPLPRS